MYMYNNIDCLNDRSKPLQFPRLFKKKIGHAFQNNVFYSYLQELLLVTFITF